MSYWRMAAFALLICTAAGASVSAEFPSPEGFVQSLGNSQLARSAKGDLNGDGLEDWVGAVVPSAGADASMHRIMVLLQKPSGRYELAGTSNRFFWSDSGSDVVEFELQIKNGTFFVRFNSYSRSCAENQRFQFRGEGAQWRLIGASYRATNTSDPRTSRWYSKDANLVTGDEILIVQGALKEKGKFPPLQLDLRSFPFESQKMFRTKSKSVCGGGES